MPRVRLVSLLLWFGYAFFVVYGSLVPLQYTPKPFDAAWHAFQHAPFLNLGVESRADWVANGVLYAPLGFLSVHLLMVAFRALPRLFSSLAAIAFCCALAVAVEFTQLFFPPRTVSLNDLLAESIGTVFGAVLAPRYSPRFVNLIGAIGGERSRLLRMLSAAYVPAYVALALFPFDFLVSWTELQGKIDSGQWGWLLSGVERRPLWFLIWSLADVATALPLGLGFGMSVQGRSPGYARAAAYGFFVGAFIEVAQFFTASGISQGWSVLTRMAGVCLGLFLYRGAARLSAASVASVLRRLTLPFMAAYLMGLLYTNGYLSLSWLGLADAVRHWSEVRLMPFYYHYYTSETQALHSLVTVSISYLPLALLAWAHRRSLGFAVSLSVLTAFAFEGGKLFLAGSHPDPTNLLLAAMTGGLGLTALRFFTAPASSLPAAPVTGPGQIADRGRPVWSAQGSAGAHWLWLAPALLAVLAWLSGFPGFRLPLMLLLLGSAFVVWRSPVAALALLPAALPVLDLAPWTGRFFFDEFDALALVCMGLAWVRTPVPAGRRNPSDLSRAIVWGLLALSLTLGVWRGFSTLHWPDANAFNNYFSDFNAVRIVKGAVWAALALGLLHRLQALGTDGVRPVALGLVTGLVFCCAAVIWERLSFGGFWDFDAAYRVTGLFSSMNTGGAYIETFIVVATPFLIVLLAQARDWAGRAAAILLLLTATYALFVTYSRGGYLAFMLVVLTSLAAALWQARRRWLGAALVGSLVVAMLLVALQVVRGGFAQSRLETVVDDLGVRQRSWAEAMRIRNDDLATTLFGMGLGKYPETSFWRSQSLPRVARFSLESEDGNDFLRLSSGDPVGFEQLVRLQPEIPYVLSLDLRARAPGAVLNVALCEKWLLASRNCEFLKLGPVTVGHAWQHVKASFTPASLDAGPWYLPRPIKLSLNYAVANSTIEVDNIRLTDAQGHELLDNGDFSQGLDHWFFAADGAVYLPWRIHNLWYGILFDLGWVGVGAYLLLLVFSVVRAIPAIRRGDAMASAALAALAGFLVIGLFENLLAAPRFLFLFLLLNGLCVLRSVAVRPAALGCHSGRVEVITGRRDRGE